MTTAGVLSLEQLNRMEVGQLTRERERSDPDPDMWRWSPLEIRKFAEMLEVAITVAADELPPATPERALSLAEAGSGIGTKLYLAQHHYGLIAQGYEISEEYAAQALKLGVCTELRDLRHPPFPPWEAFDIVYTSRPFKDDGAETLWEMEVMEAMHKGAVLISAYASVKPNWPCFYRRPYRGVWVKPLCTMTRTRPTM